MAYDRSPKVCPRCGRTYAEYPALSRYVEAYICPDCGQDEGIRPWLGMSPIPPEDWVVRPKIPAED